jgi:hypothetical protein
MNLAKTSTRPIGGKLISVEAFIVRRIASSSVDTPQGLLTPTGSVVAWELLYLWNSIPMVTEGTLNAVVQVRFACRRIVYINLSETSERACLQSRRRQTLRSLQLTMMKSVPYHCCFVELL